MFKQWADTMCSSKSAHLESRHANETIELVSSESGEGAVFEIKLPMGMSLEKRENYD